MARTPLRLPAPELEGKPLFIDSDEDSFLEATADDDVRLVIGDVERMSWSNTEVVINDGGENLDFRVESDNATNIIFVDASANALGFFGATPVAQQADIAAKTNNSGGTDDDVIAAVPAGGTGAAAGAWDTAANRDTAITAMNDNMATLTVAVNEIRTALRNLGLMA